MAENKETRYAAELAKENGELKIFKDKDEIYYIAQIKSDEEVVEEMLVPVNTEPIKIREFLSAWVQRRYEILKVAKSTIIIENFN